MLAKHPQMRDMPVVDNLLGIDLLQQHVYVHNQPELDGILRGFRQVCDTYPGRRVIIGETGDLQPDKLMSIVDFFYFPMIDPEFGEPVLIPGDIMAMYNDRPEVRAVMAYLSTGEASKVSIEQGVIIAPHQTADLD